MNGKLPIDVIVPTLNEERAISHCLEPLLAAFSVVHLVDSNSTDRTRDIAAQLGARVTNFVWNGEYPKKKQWSLDNLELQSDWVLFVDADEYVGPELLEELSRLDLAGGHSAYDVPLEYWWRGRKLEHGQTVRKRALLNRHRVRFPVMPDLGAGGMGEQEGHYQPRVDGTVGKLTQKLSHRDPDPLSTWFARHNRYSDWEAFLRAAPTARKAVRIQRTWQGQVLDRLPAKPVLLFVYNYLLRGGWRDGMQGFEYAMALSYYQFTISVKTRELKDTLTCDE